MQKKKKENKEEIKKVLEDKSFQLLLLDQELRKIEEQYKIIEQNILNIENIKINLDEIKNIKEKEFFASLGEGIFIRANIKDNEKVLINIGKDIVIEKKIDEAKEILDKKIDELYILKSLLISEAEKIIKEIKFLEEEINKIYKTKSE